jgi:hypothetical protein
MADDRRSGPPILRRSRVVVLRRSREPLGMRDNRVNAQLIAQVYQLILADATGLG